MRNFTVHDSPAAAHTSLDVANKLLMKLPVEELDRLMRHLELIPLRVKEPMHKQGQTIHHVYFPGAGGVCSLTKSMEDGATAEIATIGNEGMLGGGGFFGDDRSQGDAFAQIPGSTAYRMTTAGVLEERARRANFYNRVIRYYQGLMIQVMQTTACNGLHSAEERCCRWLLMTADRFGRDDLSLTHEFLSFMLGVRRPTITIVLGTLESA